MSEHEHGSRGSGEIGAATVERSVGKRSLVQRRYGGGRGDGAVGDGAGRGEAGTSAEAADDPFGLHLLGGAMAAAGASAPGDDDAPIAARQAHPVAIQRAADPAATAPAPAATATAGGALIVGDDQPAGEGQLGRSAFLELLRREVTATANEALGPAWSATGCPYIERWFARHAETDAASLDRMARRYAGPGPRTAAAYVPPICARLRTSIERWRSGGDVSADLAAVDLPGGERPEAPPGPPVRRKVDGGAAPAEPGSGAAMLDRLGAGSALPGGVAARMESAFGDHFDDVRIHTDDVAQAQARDQGALAFTVGNHVAFAAGRFNPGTPEGDGLLAHELAHVQQQRGGDATALARKPIEAGDESAAEGDADRAAEGVLRRLYRGVTGAVGRIGAAMSTDVNLKRCRDEPQPTHRERDAGTEGTHDGGTTDGGTTDGGTTAPAVTEATVTTALNTDPVDPATILGQLRQLTPVGVGATPTALDTAIDSRLSGDARWRAQNIRIYGPEASWPPILRGDTAAIITAARAKLTAGTAPEPASAVADALRPLNQTAQHQAITEWRRDIPAARFGGAAARTTYFDEVMRLLDGPRFGPADDLTAAAPILDLETRSEAELYAYFQQVCSHRGFTFTETDVSQAIDASNPIRYNAFNIRGYDSTTTAGSANPRLTVTTGTDFTGRMFLVWLDASGQHVRNWEWSNTGIGATKLRDTRNRGKDLLRDEGGVDRFDTDTRGRTTTAERRAIGRETDVTVLARAAETNAADATTQAATATTQAQAADAAAGTRANAGVPGTGTQALAITALTTALAARQAADRAIRNADRAIARLAGAAPPAGVAAPADSKAAAEAAKTTAEAAFDQARGAWVIARQQLLATAEEDARREWERLVADPAATEAQRTAARTAYTNAQRRNNSGGGEGNTGQMSENNALPWLQEGQYVANLRSGDKGGHRYWAVDSGMDPTGNGTAPVDRDWDADGRIDPGERDVPGTAVGTGILIHRGDRTSGSIGCQVAPDNPYGEFVDALSGSGSPARSFSYVVVESRHLPPWGGGAAGTGTAPVGTGTAPTGTGTPDGGGH